MKSSLSAVKKLVPIAVLVSLLLGLVVGCSVRNNTAATRFYHNLTTRYNVYYNGNNAFQEAYKKQLAEAPDNLAERIYLEPIVGVQKEGVKEPGGPFDPAIEKGQKAIRLHSIRTKPQQSRRNSRFYQKREYNTFIHNAWLLVGKSQYHNGDFLDAMATFSYMARLYREEPEIRNLARLWQARCYLALGWADDAERIILETPKDSPISKTALYGKAEAERAILEGRSLDAIPLLEQAIRKEQSKLAKVRLRFLKGQLEAENGLTSKAKKSFARVVSSAPAFPIEVAARLNIIALDAEQRPNDALKQLERMLRKERYKQVIDKVALAKGRIHLAQKDTLAAVEAFAEGAEKSQEKSYEYALCRISLAEIFLAQRQFVKAANELSAGIAALRETYPKYDQLKLLSEQLDELSRHAAVVEEQDSLRHLANLPEADRLKIIDSAITAYKKQIKEEGRQALLDEQREQQEAFNQEVGDTRTGRPTLAPSIPVGDKSFYFYNSELIALGKNSFTKLWGNRPLEDDWRRKNKRVSIGVQSNLSEPSPSADNTLADTLSTGNADPSQEESPQPVVDDAQNPEKRAYYLALLPLTPEAIAASDKLIQGGLEGMGSVLNEKMERFQDAIAVYSDLLSRYPSYQDRFAVYYKLYMICERLGDKANADYWRQKMKQEFPSETLTKEVSNPGYIKHLRTQDSLENDLYSRALEAYFLSNTAQTKQLAEELLATYSLSPLRPKALFLLALTKVADGDSKGFQDTLQKILDEAPNSDVAEVAEPILSDLAKGRKIMKAGYQSMDFDAIFSSSVDSSSLEQLAFQLPQFGESYLALLVFPHESIELNELLFAIAGFHFAHFTDYNLTFTLQKSFDYDLIVTNGLPNIRVARDYIREAYAPKGYMALLDSTAWLLPISKNNYSSLEKGLPLGNYINYLADSLAVYLPEASLALEAIASLAEQTTQEEPAESSPQESRKDATNRQQITQETSQEKPTTTEVEASTPPPLPQQPAIDTLSLEKEKEGKPLLPQETSDTIRKESADSTQRDSVRLPFAYPSTPMPSDSLSSDSPRIDSTALSRDSIAPGQMTLEDAKKQRQDRIKEEKARAKEEKLRRQEAEKERREALKQREKERREREKQRLEERRKREKERREAQKERDKKRKKAQKERSKKKAQ